MNLKNLFSRSVPETPTLEELAAALDAARSRVARRDKRIAELTDQVERDRKVRAEENARHAAQIELLQAHISNQPMPGVAPDTGEQQDLAAAFELLDEFEADARRGHAAQERVVALEEELAVCRLLIDELEHGEVRTSQPAFA